MDDTAKLLTPPHNYAVVHLPGRHFPGVVVQGDSLSIIVSLLQKAKSEEDPNERTELIGDVLEMLEPSLEHYKTVCRAAGLGLPFSEQK